jgi:hypothetical protein
MTTPCVHSCKGLCSALEIAEHREDEALKEYRKFRDTCDYPDVRDLLGELILDRERALRLLRERRLALDAKFETLDDITESFR